jgi:uncharacterized pyridoxal phosphate-containing UPF0001 family protein
MTEAADNLKTVLAQVRRAERKAERPEGSVTLVAVSKTFDADAMRPVIAAGQRVFGENRVQEAEGKWPALREETADIELHLIGPLQSNKAADAVALFDVIETIDREKIAGAIAKEMARQGRAVRVYVQVNEEHGLSVEGLMCIPPIDENPGPHFALLRKLAREAGVDKLSMGMSGDFMTAIEFGATSVRVGSAIFGSRS